MKILNIFEPIFYTHLLFIYDCTCKEATQYLNKKNIRANIKGCSGQTGSYVVKEGETSQNKYYIFIEKSNKGVVEELSTLLHEISHLVFMAMADCGIQINKDTDEVFSYYFEWWFKRLIKIEETNKKKKVSKKKI